MNRELTRVAGVAKVLIVLLLLLACDRQEPSSHTGRAGDPVNVHDMKGTASGPVNYVALGDSTGAGVGASEGGYVARLFKQILEARPGSKLTNLCLSGATSEDVVKGQLAPAVGAKPTLVTLGIGINDVGLGVSVEAFAANFEAIISRLKSETGAPIVVTNLPDISTAPRIPQMLRPEIQERTILFNQKIQEIAARCGVVVFDIYTTTHELLPSHPEFFSADGFHPSDVGYEHWAKEMWPVVAAAIKEEASRS